MEYEDRRESWQTTEPDRLVKPPVIRDSFLDLPKRTKVINDDDITNLKIALGTAHTIDELIGQL